MKTLLLDVDGVIADCHTPIKVFAELWLEKKVPPLDEWSDFEFPASMKLTDEEGYRFHDLAEEYFNPRDITLHPGSVEAVAELKKQAEVVFVTSHWKGMESWVPARDELLAQFDCDVIYTHSKHRVKGDILVDDKLATLKNKGDWEPVCFHRPWNQFGRWPGLRVVGSLMEVLPLL